MVREMASLYCSLEGASVGSLFGSFWSFIRMRKRVMGSVGMRRIRTPIGSESRPRTICIGQSGLRHAPTHRDGPVDTAEADDGEGGAADVDDERLAADHDGPNAEEPAVLEEAGEDVEVAAELARVEDVEDLAPDERVEHERAELGLVLGARVGVGLVAVAEDGLAGKVEDEACDELEDGLADNHLCGRVSSVRCDPRTHSTCRC